MFKYFFFNKKNPWSVWRNGLLPARGPRTAPASGSTPPAWRRLGNASHQISAPVHSAALRWNLSCSVSASVYSVRPRPLISHPPSCLCSHKFLWKYNINTSTKSPISFKAFIYYTRVLKNWRWRLRCKNSRELNKSNYTTCQQRTLFNNSKYFVWWNPRWIARNCSCFVTCIIALQVSSRFLYVIV